MTIDQDLVRCERDQRAAAHRVMRHDRCHPPVVVRQSLGDLTRREHETTGGVQDDLDRPPGLGATDCPQHALGIVDVDVPHDRKTEKRHRLLTVDQRDHRRFPFLRDAREHATTSKREHLSLEHRLQRAEDEEDPEEVPEIQGYDPMSLIASESS